MLGSILLGAFAALLLGGLNDNNRGYYDDNDRIRQQLYDERNKKNEEALELFNQRKNDLISSFTSELKNDFSQKHDFCKKEIEFEFNNYHKELNISIDKITSIEDQDNIFISQINKSIKQLSKKMSELEVKHLNILLVGPSGVGKSFLINSILKLKKNNLAETKISKPTTKTFNVYESKNVPNIRLIDSRGIEKGEYNVDSVVEEITKFVEKKELSGNPDDFIHCIWYCITGTRFEDIEEQTLLKLSQLYDDSKLPVMVVYTQAIIPEYYKTIEKDIKKIKNNIEFIPVIADDMKLSDGKNIKSKNLDILISKSISKAKNAVSSSVFSAIRKIIKNDTYWKINNNFDKLKEKIHEYISSNSIQDFNEEKNYNNIFKNILFFDETNKDLKTESKDAIIDLVKTLNEKNNNIMNQCLYSYIKEKSEDLGKKLAELQTDVNNEKAGYLNVYKKSNEYSDEMGPVIKNSIFEKVKNIEFMNYIKLLPLKILGLLANHVKSKLISFMISNSPLNSINEIIKEQFNKIKL